MTAPTAVIRRPTYLLLPLVAGAVLARACGLSSPGTWTMLMFPGLKPSFRFSSVVEM